MVNFSSSVVLLSTYVASGDREVHVSNSYKTPDDKPADIAIVNTVWDRKACFMFASTTEYSSYVPCNCESVYTGTIQGTQSTSIGNITKWINSTTEAGNFTRDFNAAFGTSYTRTQVYQQLQTIYGSDYKWFGAFYFSGGLFRNPNLPSGYNIVVDSGELQIGCDYCDTWVSSSIPEDYTECFTGTAKYINPDYVSIIGNSGIYLTMYFLGSEDYSPEKLRFNVYVDGVIGEKGPNITINWTNLNPSSELSTLLISPHIWGHAITSYTDPEPPTIGMDIILDETSGKIVPNPANNPDGNPINNTYSWSGEYSTGYIAASETLTEGLSTAEKVLLYGLDGIPSHIRFFMRFDYESYWGDLWYVDIPYKYEGAAYITPHKIDNSLNGGTFDTDVIVIGGTTPDDTPDDPDEPEQGYDDDPTAPPTGDGPYPDPGDQPDLTPYDSTGYPGEAVLTKTYKLTKQRLQDVGTKLWSQSYFNVLKVQSNPIENIIACRWYPMNITGSGDEGIVIGDVSIGTNGDPIPTTYRKVIGTFTYKGVVSTNGKNYTPGYLAQSPYTTIKLHLPYVGTMQLDASEIFNRQLHVEYIVDIITGDILVLLKLGSKKEPYMSLSGKMGVDIPLSGSDRAQVQIAAASRAATAMIGAAGQMIGGNVGAAAGMTSGILSMAGMDYSTQRVIQHSSVCGSYDNRAVVIEMQCNKAFVSAGYAKQHGLPSHQYMKLTKGMGFIQISRRTVIDVAMTDEENRMLETILVQGCYF